ncbi:hypothetical protein BSZ31_14750 [Limnobacter sp. SAORIC-690]|nr:hypothetical protein BSZ31_14750 [Limnobacter sp. SAORIC-690]
MRLAACGLRLAACGLRLAACASMVRYVRFGCCTALPTLQGFPADSQRGAIAQQSMRRRVRVSHAPSQKHQAGIRRLAKARRCSTQTLQKRANATQQSVSRKSL